MTLRAMWQHVDSEGLDVRLTRTSKSVTKRQLAKKILAAYGAADLEKAAAGGAPNTVTPDFDLAASNREFEELCDGTDPAVEEVETPKRGGVRPGAGRPRGMTEEKAMYNRLSEQPHPAVKQMFELLFDAWATKSACPSVKLTEQEARDIALPWTNVLELMGVADRIPNWIVVALACGWNTLSIVKAKAAIAREAREWTVRPLNAKVPEPMTAQDVQPQPAGT